LIAVLTWSELNKRLEAAEDEKATLMREAADASERMKARLQQSEETEWRLRSDIRAGELSNLRKQHAALKTS